MSVPKNVPKTRNYETEKPPKNNKEAISINKFPDKNRAHKSEKQPLYTSKAAFEKSILKPVPNSVPCSSKPYRKRFLKEKTPYKLPTILRPVDGDWSVKYFYEHPDHPGKFKEFRVRDGVNYIKDPEEKEAAIIKLCDDVTYALEKKGYNPFIVEEKIKPHINRITQEIEEKSRLLTLPAAFKWVIESKRSKGRSIKTLEEYQWFEKFFIPWCADNGLKYINDPTIDHIEMFLSEYLENMDWSAKTYNNKIAVISAFFSYLVAKRKMPNNPIGKKMLERMDHKAEKNRYYDQETLNIILPKVQNKPLLRRMIQWTYYTCARGTELRQLKVGDIDLNIKKIVIKAENSKTGARVGKRNIPLCQELHEIIVTDKLTELPADWYVFGDRGVPGPNSIHRNYFSFIYYEIKKDLGLDFKFTIYSFKHTRVVDLLVAGFDPVKVMHITGHTNWGSFQKYIRELGAVMDKQLIGNTLTLNI